MGQRERRILRSTEGQQQPTDEDSNLRVYGILRTYDGRKVCQSGRLQRFGGEVRQPAFERGRQWLIH